MSDYSRWTVLRSDLDYDCYNIRYLSQHGRYGILPHQRDIEEVKPELKALVLDRVNELKHHSLVTNVDYRIAITGSDVRAIIEFELCGVPMEHQLIATFGYTLGNKNYYIHEYNIVRDCNFMECLRTGGAEKEDERFEL